MIDFDCIRFDPNGHPEDLIHNKDIGIAQHGETTEGDEELNKATTQCPISKLLNMFMYMCN